MRNIKIARPRITKKVQGTIVPKSILQHKIELDTEEIELSNSTLNLEKGKILILNNSINNGTIVLNEGCTIICHSKNISQNLKIELRGKNITINNLKWQNDGICLYSNYNCSGLTLMGCQLNSEGNNAVKIIADKISGVIQNIQIKNCTFQFKRMGIELQNHGNSEYKIDKVLIQDSKFFTESESDYRYGMSLSGYGKNAKITNCKFNNCIKGIELVGFSDVDIKDSLFNCKDYSIISSNSRKMDNFIIQNNKLNGQLYLYNCTNSVVSDNEINCPYVEIKSSQEVVLTKNNITTTGHYSIMLNKASYSKIIENVINQKSTSNWSVIRCYGKDATDNLISKNKITRANKTGKLWDQYNGASNNTFES